MKNVICLFGLLAFANLATAQCENGRCSLPQFQFSRFVASAPVAAPATYNLGFSRPVTFVRYDLGSCAAECNESCVNGVCSPASCAACYNPVAQAGTNGVSYGSTLLSGDYEVRSARESPTRRQPRFRLFARLRGGCGCR